MNLNNGVTKKNQQFKKWLNNNWFNILFAVFGILIILLAVLFVIESGGFVWWRIKPEYWAFFGSFLAAFLLAITLFYQIRAYLRQQVETKFFELIKYYRDNLSEMTFRNPFYYKDAKTGREIDAEYISGRRVMKLIFDQYLVGRKLAEQVIKSVNNSPPKSSAYKRIQLEYKKNNWKNNFPDAYTWEEQLKINEIAYLILFWGIPKGIDVELKRSLLKVIDDENFVSNLLKLVKTIPALFECEIQAKSVMKMLTNERTIIDITSPSGLIKFFGGHQYHLGHYFRHFYQAVKYIDSQPRWILSKSEKYGYIKTLRAQLSNYEQALLFINSLTQLGLKWEYDDNSKNNFISEYHLIKNLPEYFIPKMHPHHYYPNVNFEWKPINYLKMTKNCAPMKL